MMSVKKFVVHTVIVCFFCSALGYGLIDIGYSFRDPMSGQLNIFILAGSILLGPGLLVSFFIELLTSVDLIIYIISFVSQLIGYLSFAFAMRWIFQTPRFQLCLNNSIRAKKYMKNWIFQKSGFQLWLNNSIRAKKYIKYSLRFIVYTPIIILFVYFYQTQPTVEGKNWIKNKWSFLEKGECEKVFPYLGDSEIRDLETIKNIALGNNHKKLRASDCHLKIISNDLKINMTREQIDKLKPIDIFCWCNKHYEKFFQDNYNISFSSQTKAFYTYEIKKKNETIGEITIAHFSFSDGPWMVGWVSSECSESN